MIIIKIIFDYSLVWDCAREFTVKKFFSRENKILDISFKKFGIYIKYCLKLDLLDPNGRKNVLNNCFISVFQIKHGKLIDYKNYLKKLKNLKDYHCYLKNLIKFLCNVIIEFQIKIRIS